MDDPLRGRLIAGAKTLGLQIDDAQIDSLLGFQRLLERWNSAYNLTAIRDGLEMVVRHLLDSLAVGPHLIGERFIDVGTGAGLPGIPLAIVFPERDWLLLDSNGKKTRFLFQVKTQLGLGNIEVVESRVETFHPASKFDGVLTRAFADLSLTCDRCHHILTDSGRLYAMKSKRVDEELVGLSRGFSLETNIELSVPYLDESRWLTVLARTNHEDCR